jgi:CRP/FNR family cyclic AMP-dependent transcriptional regulator
MFIEKAYLFHGMSQQFMDRIAACLARESGEAGTFLFKRGDPANYLYILEEGRVRLSYGEEGHVAFVISNPGDAIGWSSLVERDVYMASAECLSFVRIAKIPGAQLAEIFNQDPSCGLIFFKRLARLIGERLVGFYKLIPAAHGEKRAAPGF